MHVWCTGIYCGGPFLAKHLVDVAPAMSVSCYTMLYILYGVFILMEMVSLLNLLRLTKLTPKQPRKSSYGHTLMIVCLKPSTVLFFGTVFINGVLLSSYIFYFIPFLQGH